MRRVDKDQSGHPDRLHRCSHSQSSYTCTFPPLLRPPSFPHGYCLPPSQCFASFIRAPALSLLVCWHLKLRWLFYFILLGVWAFYWHAYLCTVCIYCPWRQEGSIRCPRTGVKCGYEPPCVYLVPKRGSSGRVVRTFNHRDISSAPGVSL